MHHIRKLTVRRCIGFFREILSAINTGIFRFGFVLSKLEFTADLNCEYVFFFSREVNRATKYH